MMTDRQSRQTSTDARTIGALAAGGLVTGLLASSCCLLPLLLVSAGVGGAWLSQLTALAPYQPLFLAASVALLGFGFWRVYGRRQVCAGNQSCATPGSAVRNKTLLWLGVVAVLASAGSNSLAAFLL
jgi:mercuric ion transport protein